MCVLELVSLHLISQPKMPLKTFLCLQSAEYSIAPQLALNCVV